MIESYITLTLRRNKTSLWDSTDSPENYKVYHDALKSQNPYKPGDFTYAFNDYGFRCDNFSLPSDINVVFLGCSFTEGIGLPVENIWTYQLLSKIRQKTNKNIPYWNLAMGGMGIDTQSLFLHWFSKMKKIDYVFALIPPLARREYLYESTIMKHWNIHTNNHKVTIVDELFSDDQFLFYENYRSLTIIDSIVSNRSVMYCTPCWPVPDLCEILKLKEFNSLNYFPAFTGNKEYARDGMHHGPTYHKGLADEFWLKVEHLFNP